MLLDLSDLLQVGTFYYTFKDQAMIRATVHFMTRSEALKMTIN